MDEIMTDDYRPLPWMEPYWSKSNGGEEEEIIFWYVGAPGLSKCPAIFARGVNQMISADHFKLRQIWFHRIPGTHNAKIFFKVNLATPDVNGTLEWCDAIWFEDSLLDSRNHCMLLGVYEDSDSSPWFMDPLISLRCDWSIDELVDVDDSSSDDDDEEETEDDDEEATARRIGYPTPARLHTNPDFYYISNRDVSERLSLIINDKIKNGMFMLRDCHRDEPGDYARPGSETPIFFRINFRSQGGDLVFQDFWLAIDVFTVENASRLCMINFDRNGIGAANYIPPHRTLENVIPIALEIPTPEEEGQWSFNLPPDQENDF